MIDWYEALEASCARSVEGLQRRGFTRGHAGCLTGDIHLDESTVQSVTVVFPQGFPFTAPRVYPGQDLPWSWHRELDGAMCLYPADGRESLPWLDTDDFIASIRRWLLQLRDGWTTDTPDVDLERYFPPAQDPRLLLYDDLGPLVNRYVRFRCATHTITLLGSGSVPAKAVTGRRRAFGFLADLGEPAHPPRTWEQIAELLDPAVGATVDKAVRDRRIRYLLLRYRRRSNTAVLALEIGSTAAGIELRALPSAHSGSATLTLRSGTTAEKLRGKHVLVIGVGAIGSTLCDALARAGIGHLTIRDSDILRPGNLIRHLATPDFVGQHKVTAIRAIITAQPYTITTVVAEPTDLTDPGEVVDLLDRYDLVIDTTADAAASAMLATAARASGTHILSACIQQEGHIVRVDVIPPITGPPNAPTLPSSTSQVTVYEPGCGEPVSLTPSFAVTEAAALTARHAIGLLTGSPLTDAGQTRVYK